MKNLLRQLPAILVAWAWICQSSALRAQPAPPAVATAAADNPSLEDVSDSLKEAADWAIQAAMGGLPWTDCRSKLESALSAAGPNADGTEAERCRSLLLAMDAAIGCGEPDADAPLEAQARSIPDTNIPPVVFRYPHMHFYGQKLVEAVAEQNRTLANPDPALLLYDRGYDAIPVLLEHLDDLAATRITYMPQPGGPAEPIRVCDIALGLIEAISTCNFQASRSIRDGFLSTLPQSEADAVRQNVRDWWSKAQSLSPDEAILLHLRTADSRLRTGTVQALVMADRLDLVQRLPDIPETRDDAVTGLVSNQVAAAGVREPLDAAQRAISEPSGFDTRSISMLARYGTTNDIQEIRRRAEDAARTRKEGDLQKDAILNVANALSRPAFLPVLLDLAARQADRFPHPESVDGRQVAQIGRMDRTVEVAHGLLGTDATARQARDEPVGRRIAALDRLLDWWRAEGVREFGFGRCGPAAPAGIQ